MQNRSVVRSELALTGYVGAAAIMTAIIATVGLSMTTRAIDGDSIRQGLTTYRLVGMDAPEITHARCHVERYLGHAAREWLAARLKSGTADLGPTGQRDRYGRPLATLTIDGEDVAAAMIARGLARPYAGGRRASWCIEP